MWDQKTGINVSAHEASSQQQDKNKLFESTGEDSGFHSGPQHLYSSEIIDSGIGHTVDTPVTENFQDSGAIIEDNQDRKQESMIVQSGVDFGLSEWFCDLSLNNSTNNLSSCRQSAEETKYSKSKPFSNRPLWELCYVQDADGDTQLHLSILGKYVQAAWAIIRLAPVPAFLDIRNDDAHSPLHLAVLTKQPGIVRCLLLAGAKASTQDREGNTPLHLACMNSDKACVDALTLPITPEDLKQFHNSECIPQVLPLDLEQRNYQGERCVHIAAQRNDVEILRHLVWLGADINAREGRSGYTALHFACENSNEKVVQFLLNDCNKLNVETCTYGLLTAYQIAAILNNQNLMGSLERYGAELRSPPESDDDSYYDSSDDEYDTPDFNMMNNAMVVN